MTKRVLSLLLALIMALSLCVPAFAADEPEVSADEPATIAAIDISVLQDAVAQAEAMKPWTNWQKNGGGDATTEIAALKTAYEKAKGILDDIKDSGGIDVWQLTHEASEVNDAATGLINAIGALTDEITDAQEAEMLSEQAALEAVIEAGEEWYNPDYLAKAQAVLDQLTAALASGKFADYVAVELVVNDVWPGSDYAHFSQCADGGVDWKAGCKATKADYEELYAAVEAAADLLASGIYTPNLTFVNLQTAVNQYRGYFVVSQPNNLASWITVHDVNLFLENLKTLSAALIEDGYTIQVTNTFVAGTFGYVSVSWSAKDSNYDNHQYMVKASYNDGELKAITGPIPASVPVWTTKTGTFWVNASTFGLTKFPVGGKLTVNFYDAASGELELSKEIIISAYNGPSITSVTYSPDTITVKFDKSLGTANAHPGTEGAYESLYVVVKDPDGKIVATGDPTAKNPVAGLAIVSGETGTWATSVTLALTEKTAAVGDYVVELWVEESDASGLTNVIARGSKSVEVPAITAYANYTKLTEAIAKAEKMTDYVATSAARADGKSTQDVRDILTNNLEACARFTAVAATTPNTTWNQATVDDLLKELNYAMSLMIEGADSAAFEAALAEAEALIPTDYNNWDNVDAEVGGESLTGMDDIIEFYEEWADAYLPLPNDAASRQLLSTMTTILKTAMAKLEVTVPYADLATLKAMIDSVPARLAADDYSAESKEAVEAAAAAGKVLLDKKGVKQSEVLAAIKALEDALNNLTTVKSDAVPPCPVGNGWATAENGDYYYYDQNGKLVQNGWVKSKGLWYHMGATGKMDTGFLFIDDEYGGGWYYLNPSNAKGTMGRMFTGWKMIDGHWAWFETRSNGHQGQCTYTDYQGDYVNYRPVK